MVATIYGATTTLISSPWGFNCSHPYGLCELWVNGSLLQPPRRHLKGSWLDESPSSNEQHEWEWYAPWCPSSQHGCKRGQVRVIYNIYKGPLSTVGEERADKCNWLCQCCWAVHSPNGYFWGKVLNLQWTVGEVPGTYYGMSDKGWTDQKLFKHWLKDHFLQYTVPNQPLLILLDGHSSRYEPASIELARTEGDL